MPYLFCAFKAETVKDYTSFSEQKYASNPELVAQPGQSALDIRVLGVIPDLTKISYTNVYTDLAYKCPGRHRQVIYCIKVPDSAFRVTPQGAFKPFAIEPHELLTVEQFKIASMTDVIGCIIYSMPRIADGINYCVVNNQAEASLRQAFMDGAKTSNQNMIFAKELRICEAEFKIPDAFMLPKPAAAPQPPFTKSEFVTEYRQLYASRLFTNPFNAMTRAVVKTEPAQPPSIEEIQRVAKDDPDSLAAEVVNILMARKNR